MGSAHFLAVQFLGAHDPYIPNQEPQMPPGLEPKSAPMGDLSELTEIHIKKQFILNRYFFCFLECSLVRKCVPTEA